MMKLTNDRIIEWDVHNWSQALPFWEEVLKQFIPSETKILALGERSGGLSIWLAQKGYKVICSDFGGIAENVQNEHKQYLGNDNIQYRDINIFKIPFSDHEFDIVIAKSVIGGLKLIQSDKSTRSLENQKLAIQEIFRVLKDSGYFLGAENLVGHKAIQRLREFYKKGNIGWRHLNPNEVIELFAPFSKLKTKFFGLLPGLFKSNIVNLVIYKINTMLDKILNDNHKYICFFCARK